MRKHGQTMEPDPSARLWIGCSRSSFPYLNLASGSKKNLLRHLPASGAVSRLSLPRTRRQEPRVRGCWRGRLLELCCRIRWPVFCLQLQEETKKEMKARGLIPRFLARRQPLPQHPGTRRGFSWGGESNPKACWGYSWHKSSPHGGEEPVPVPSQTADCSLSNETSPCTWKL